VYLALKQLKYVSSSGGRVIGKSAYSAVPTVDCVQNGS
jgi:hypothetical protein